MSFPPLVSIGFPIYNGEKSVGRALDSILTQDFEDFELIIADNASTDSTAKICEAYAKRDARILFLRNEKNIGVSPNHNLVFEKSRGKYFAWAAHDVEQLPGMLSRCVGEMQSSSRKPVLVYPRCQLIGETRMPRDWQQPSIASNWPQPHRRVVTVIDTISYVTQHYGLMLADELRKTRLNGSYASSDYVLTAELAMLGEIREIPEVLVRRTIEPKSGTAAVLKSQKAWAAWLDPKMKNRRFLLPLREKLALEYIRAAWHIPIKPADKLLCLIAAPAAHYRKYFVNLAQSWGRRLVRISGRVKQRFAA